MDELGYRCSAVWIVLLLQWDFFLQVWTSLQVHRDDVKKKKKSVKIAALSVGPVQMQR